MAQEVFGIMHQAMQQDSAIPAVSVTSASEQQNHNYHPSEVSAMPTHVQEPVMVISAPAPPPPVNVGGPPSAPPIVNAGPKPSAPPPVNAGPKPSVPPPPAGAGAPPPKAGGPPPPAGAGAGAPPPKAGGLLEQIQRGAKLKPTQIQEFQAGKEASTGNTLADTLLSAMSKYRVDIVGKDNEADDDWD